MIPFVIKPRFGKWRLEAIGSGAPLFTGGRLAAPPREIGP